MDKPKYMRFFPDDYLEDTESMELEEQGAYMRLLCKMWKRNGKIPNDDREISRMLGVHPNKWTKIKPYVLPFFRDHSPGFLTQKRLQKEYRRSVDKMLGRENTHDDTDDVTPHDTPHDTGGITPGDTPHDTHRVREGEANEKQGNAFENGEKNSPRELDLEESSRSESNTKFKNRLEDGGGESCGQLPAEMLADLFLDDVRALFRAHKMDMPRDNEILRGWLEDGIHPFRHILPSVKKVLARISGGACDPPKSWKYFAKEVYRKQKGGQHGKAKK